MNGPLEFGQNAVRHADDAALVGFADLARLAESVRQGFPRAVVFRHALTPAVVANIADGPHTQAYPRPHT